MFMPTIIWRKAHPPFNITSTKPSLVILSSPILLLLTKLKIQFTCLTNYHPQHHGLTWQGTRTNYRNNKTPWGVKRAHLSYKPHIEKQTSSEPDASVKLPGLNLLMADLAGVSGWLSRCKWQTCTLSNNLSTLCHGREQWITKLYDRF